ncbi:MAG TPA: hypothetical protein VGV36_05215 [Solirubrobacteraceae bacterium]|nr:hypothetical protein [Solirubrobacteraceae bacterium]
MDLVVLLAVMVLLGAVAWAVLSPLRSGQGEEEAGRDEARRADLEAAKEAKYREIRDAELDHRTGKLSEADWRAQDRRLRAEAVELLRAMEELE